MVKTLIFFVVLIPKKAIMDNYEKIISEVSVNYKSYDEKEWKRKIENFERLPVGLYEKFKDDFSTNEKII